MITEAWTLILVSGLVASAIAWLAALMRESGIRPVRGFAAFLKAQPKAGRILIGAAFASAWIVAGAKPGGTRSGDGARHGDVKPRGECSGDGAPAVAEGTAATGSRDGGGAVATADAGLALVRMGTGEAFDLSPPSNATVCADWLAFGAAEDWTYLSFSNWSVRVGDASSSRLRVHSCGWAEALPDRGAATGATDRAHSAYMPLRAPLCIVPKANWPLLGGVEQGTGSYRLPTTNYQLKSLFWHCLTPSNTLLLTWRNALYAHRADAPISVQAEIRQGGGADFRYSLPRPAEAADGQSSSVAIGVSAGGSGWLTNALPPDATSVRLESGLERRCAACLETFASRLGGLDPMSCPPGSTNTVWEHIAYAGTPDGAFTIPQSSDAAAVLEVSVSGSGTGVLDVGGAAFPLVGPGGAVASVQSAAAVQPAVAIPAAIPLRSPPPSPPSLRVQVPRGQTVPLYVTGDGTLSVSLSSGDFAFGVLPSLARRILSGWINFPNAKPTPACVHDYGAESVTVTLPAGQGADGLRCRWSGPGVRNLPPRSAEIGGLNPRIAARVTYSLSHPLRLFGEASGEQLVRFCPVPPDPDPDRPDPYDPDDDDEDEPEPEPDYPHTEERECECDREACDGSCRCCPTGCCGKTDPDDYERTKTNVAHMSGILLVRDPPLFGGPIRLDLPGGEPRCCPCPSHARRRVELVCARRLRVADEGGADFTAAAETVDVRVAATEPSRWPGDAFAAFATNGAIHLECAYTALGVGIGREGLDLAALNALSPDFGLPVPVTTNAADAAPVRLRTDVLLRGMNVHVAFEGASAPFALWVPDTEGGGWRKAASSDGGALDVTLPAWRRMSGADGHSAPFDTEARVTAEGAGTATLVFRAWGVAGGLFVEDEARQRLTALAPCVRADIDRDGKMGESDGRARLAGRPFRFWFNEDRDKGDFVGQVSDLTPNARDLKVNGRLDLVNLFPVVVDASPFLRAWGGAAEMRLRAWRASGDGLRFCVLGRGFSSGDVPGLASGPVETADGKPLESASLTPLGYDGAGLAELAGRPLSEPVALAFEAAGPVGDTEGPELAVSLGGAEVYRERLPVSITSVDDLYRIVSMRGAEGDPNFSVVLPGSCLGWPDEELSDGYVFFLHGFFVSEANARAWNRAMFKRLWWAGSRARYCGVTWNGDAGLLTAFSYHLNAFNAQKTASCLKRLVNSVSGTKSVIAHSLGNMVVCEAIREGMSADRYFMLNAAVASEAFDGSLQATADNVGKYVPDSWKPYPSGTWCANWHALFPASDDRSRLKWKDAFAEVCDRTDVYNYYSTGDQVLEADDDIPSAFSGAINFRWPVSFSWSFPFLNVDRPYDLTLDRYAWQKQEVLKGVDPLVATLEAGWRFESDCTPDEARQRLWDGSIVTNAVFGHDVEAFHRPSSPIVDVFRARAYNVPAVSKPLGFVDVSGTVMNYDLNLEVRPNSWGRTHPIYGNRWLHSDIKDMSYYYVHDIFIRLCEEAELK